MRKTLLYTAQDATLPTDNGIDIVVCFVGRDAV